MSKKQPVVKHSENPFIGELEIHQSSKQVKVTPMGKDDNVILNQSTGEIQGTHVVTYKKVDADKFVKIFTDNVALTFGLKSPGRKAFDFLLWCVQHGALGRDQVYMSDYERAEFAETNNVKFSINTFIRGREELVENKIIARSMRTNWYYINPNFIFNGDRIAFTNAYEIK